MSGTAEDSDEQARESASDDAASPPIVFHSDELLQGRREVWIEHGTEMYRLRLTSAGKLYLTK